MTEIVIWLPEGGVGIDSTTHYTTTTEATTMSNLNLTVGGTIVIVTPPTLPFPGVPPATVRAFPRPSRRSDGAATEHTQQPRHHAAAAVRWQQDESRRWG
jgi:hypothetical protein